MKHWEPDYAASFHCLAGSCPDTCCKDWEIILDGDTLARYRALSGPFADEIQSAITTDAEGDTMFRLTDGHCPLLREDGLCRVQLALGEEGLCETCRQHPRFYEEYGAARELTLSLSCPAAAELLLSRSEPVRFVCHADDAPPSGCNTLDPSLYLSLRRAREAAISMVQNRKYTIPDRLSLLLLFSVRLQTLLNGASYGRLERLIGEFTSERACRRHLSRARRLRARKAAFFPCWMLLNNMEHLTKDFPRLLDLPCTREPSGVFDPAFSAQWEHLTVYFLWRYFLKASVDARVLTQVQCCVFHVLSIAVLFASVPDKSALTLRRIAGLYSKEVEHSDENLRLLRRVFDRKTLSWKALVSLLS